MVCVSCSRGASAASAVEVGRGRTVRHVSIPLTTNTHTQQTTNTCKHAPEVRVKTLNYSELLLLLLLLTLSNLNNVLTVTGLWLDVCISAEDTAFVFRRRFADVCLVAGSRTRQTNRGDQPRPAGMRRKDKKKSQKELKQRYRELRRRHAHKRQWWNTHTHTHLICKNTHILFPNITYRHGFAHFCCTPQVNTDKYYSLAVINTLICSHIQ